VGPGSQRGSARIIIVLVFSLVVVGVAVVAAGYVAFVHRASARSSSVQSLAPASPTPKPVAHIRVIAVWPTRGAKEISPSAAIEVRFSAPLAADSPTPRLTPNIPGSWQAVGPYVRRFLPTGHLPLSAKVHLSVPAGSAGAHGRDGGRLAHRYSTSFSVGTPTSVLRLQQLLAELGYLPLSFQPKLPATVPASAASGASSTAAASPSASAGAAGQPSVATQGSAVPSPSAAASSGTPEALASPSPSAAASSGTPTGSPSPSSSASSTPSAGATSTAGLGEPSDSALISLEPMAGPFRWRYHHIPRAMSALWQRGVYTTLIKGAVMAFEADHGLADDGVVGPQVWVALLRAAARHQIGRKHYDFIEVSLSVPQMLRVWQDGKVIYRCPANTGIASRPTEAGTFPVFERFVSTTMSGTNPDGSKYSDPGVPYVSYFNGGDAVHGFLRSQYGYPQSLGCVELSYATAAIVFRYDPIGTLVSVS
jgi:peptidoglycan hydrolase-like protein with peptidoglycan-binding domain